MVKESVWILHWNDPGQVLCAAYRNRPSYKNITYFTATQKQDNISRQLLTDQLLFFTLQPWSISLNTVTIRTETANKMRPCSRIYYSSVFNCSTCFERHTAHHQELKNCNCSLWFYMRLWLPATTNVCKMLVISIQFVLWCTDPRTSTAHISCLF